MSQRSDPLRSATPPPRIDALVPCAEKDLPTLPLVIASIHSASVNPVDRVVVVVRRDLLQRARAAMDAECDLVAEEDLLDEATRNLVDSIVPADRRGWVVQQLAKFEVVASSPREGVLVVDADTVMLRPRTWLTDSRQLLVPVHEFHSPYEQHFQRFFGRTERAATVSWVAHHQLMRPPTVRAMFGLAKNERSRRLGEWVAAADFSQPSALSEYHTYGRWLETRAPDGYALGRWGNKAVPRTSVEDLGALPVAGASDGVRRLRREFPTSVSISMHAYL